ncbi:MAG: Stk1 family PASTA domain-containing Ser/Thr kinase [Lactobacillales bacterium]|jgi:serine/threonine-protein kinase|nr:Stk1 family PASTA domain-containing Ser/Thr kinase [Lactobacillales bacterium]
MIEIGMIFNRRYKILSTLGSGGMANVFLAHDLILDRDVAIKVLRFNFQNDPIAIRRFQREALAASELVHPNVVAVYDVGEENGMQYLVMEYVKGMDLKKYIQQNSPISNERVVEIMRQILAATELAHEHRIIHRDLKPQNILVDEDGNVKITDFGIAIAFTETSITQTNSMLGSVHYLSPEQARGSIATNRSDIYSMGIILYELLTGKVPFDGESAVTIALKHFQEEIPSIRERNPAVPQALENVALIATAKDPMNRYPSSDAMSDDLATALSPERANEPRVSFSDINDQETQAITPIQPPRQATITPAAADEVDKEEKSREEKIVDLYKAGLNPDKIARDLSVSVAYVKQCLIADLYDKGFSVEEIARELGFPTSYVKKALKEATKLGLVKNMKKKKRKRWIIPLVLLALLGGFFAYLVATSPSDVKVPNVANMTEAQATEKLESKKLKVGEVVEVEDSKVKEGSVVRTNPEIGTTVKENREVTLYISKGTAKLKLSDYVGQTYTEVSEDLISKGFTKKRIVKKEETSDEVPKGQIISQSPRVGAEVNPKSDKITLTVSSGANGEEIGDYTGMSLSYAQRALVGLGFKESQIKVNYEVNDTVDPDTVIRQSPTGGSKVNLSDGTIILYVSKASDKITLRDMMGYSKKETQDYLDANGLKLESKENFSDSVEAGHVISFSPSAGTEVPKGSTVTVTFSKGKDPASEPATVNYYVTLNFAGVTPDKNYIVTVGDANGSVDSTYSVGSAGRTEKLKVTVQSGTSGTVTVKEADTGKVVTTQTVTGNTTIAVK